MLEIEVITMSDAGAATVLGEIETLVLDYIKKKGLRRVVDVRRK